MKRLLTLGLAIGVLTTADASALDSVFEPLTVAEQRTAFEVVLERFRQDPALPHAELLFPLVALAEPPKARVLALQKGQSLPRRAELQVLHHGQHLSWFVLVDLASKRVVELTPVHGQPGLSNEEYTIAQALVVAHEPWQRAVRARGLDPARIYLDVWAGPGPGVSEQDAHTRLAQCLAFLRQRGLPANDNPYDRPIEGLVATVDLSARRVVALIDHGARPVSTDSGNAPTSQPLPPLVIQEPNGSELSVQGHLVRYRNWQFYAVLKPREGLVLYDVRFHDHGVLRRIAYRLALSEIYVPYGIADPTWTSRHAFDVGDYYAGTLAQPLELGVDVPANAVLLDATLFSDRGPTPENPDGKLELPHSVGVYVRPAGVLWTRTDPVTRKRDSRSARELVVSWSSWLGNYIYAFDWVFKLDGSIEVQSQLHGTTLNRGAGAALEASAPKVGKDGQAVFVAAPHHQHFLNFRLDLDIDGEKNSLMEMEVASLADPQFKNAFDTRTQTLGTEGFRDVAPLSARHWHIESWTRKNAFGKRTGYALEPDALAFPYSTPDYVELQRAAFAQHALWFTRQRDAELYAAGDYPLQAPPGAGVGAFVTPPEPLAGQDIVLWYTVGFTHIARPEDYPVMSGETVSFKLVPRGFFDQNPALSVGPAPAP